jgi:thymidine phosphorylase
MKTLDRAGELAKTLVQIGQDAGVKTSALLTDMSTPLGLKIGNALEVEESIEVLTGGGPADVIEITVELAREMLAHSGINDVDPSENLQNGKAMDVFRKMISAQGGDLDTELPKAREFHTIRATGSGLHFPTGCASCWCCILAPGSRKRAQGGRRSVWGRCRVACTIRGQHRRGRCPDDPLH